MTRVLVVGLDCLPPAVLGDGAGRPMPAVAELADTGLGGVLRSTLPPITCSFPSTAATVTSESDAGSGAFMVQLPCACAVPIENAKSVHPTATIRIIGDAIPFPPILEPPF